jgi:glucokinase
VSAVGVDIGGTKLLAVRVDPDGGVVTDHKQASPRTRPELVAEVVEAARRLCGGQPSALGVGVPGLVDDDDEIRFTPNLPGVAGMALGTALRKELPGVKVWIGNDANAACWGEYQVGAGQGFNDMLMVTIGTGIGGGLISDSRLFEGANRFAGEFGHMVVDPDGRRCPCGRRGCWERYASGAGLGYLGREAAMAGAAPGLVALAGGDPEAVRGEHVTAAAALGDEQAIEIMARFGWWVAMGLANLVNALDPQAIVIGGGLVEAGELLLAPVRQSFRDLVEAVDLRPEVPILAAALGPKAGSVGAGLLGETLGRV